MSTVAGSQFTIYTGDNMNVIGCEDSCTLTINTSDINVTTKGSGRGTNREYGRYDAVIQSSGVVFMYANAAAALAGSKTDPASLPIFIIQGKKVVCKAQITDGTTTKWFICSGIISSCVFTGQSGDFMRFDVTILLDGELYFSSNLSLDSAYNGPTILNYTPSATLTADTIAALAGNTNVYYVLKNGIMYDLVLRYTGIALFGNDVTIKTTDGYTEFAIAVGTSDLITFVYDPA